MTEIDWLDNEWLQLMERLEVKRNTAGGYSKLLRAHQSPFRIYHDFSHIRFCVDLAKGLRHLCELPDAVTFALLFHHVVHDTKASNSVNVRLSAKVALEVLESLNISNFNIKARVAECIIATGHNVFGNISMEAKIAADVDLAILGSSEVVYNEYAKNVRSEYIHLPEDVFNERRLRLLGKLLTRAQNESLYHTAYFQKRRTELATQNIAREMEKIRNKTQAKTLA